MSAALAPNEAKKARKRREVKRRQVVNMPDDFAWYLQEHAQSLGYENVPDAIRCLALAGLEASHAVSRNRIKVDYKKHQVDQMHAEIAALEDDA